MHTDYLPQSPNGLLHWLTTQETELTTAIGDTMGAAESERAAFLAAVAAWKAPIAEIVELTDRLKQLKASLPEVRQAQLPILRAFINRSLTFPGCTPAIIERLEWAPVGGERDLEQARPRLSAEAQRGGVKIVVKRAGFEAANVYVRRRGQEEWTLLAERKRKFPLYDQRPLAVAGAPEVREYRAIGVVDDEEIGQPSEVQEVVFAG
jgi:hypothetical protein